MSRIVYHLRPLVPIDYLDMYHYSDTQRSSLFLMVHVAKDGMHDLAFRTDRSVILTEHRGKRTKSDWPIRHVQQRAALVSPAESMRSFRRSRIGDHLGDRGEAEVTNAVVLSSSKSYRPDRGSILGWSAECPPACLLAHESDNEGHRARSRINRGSSTVE